MLAPQANDLLNRLRVTSSRWVVTGAAGFIGSHLVQALLKLDQNVVGIDNFSTGKQANLDDVANTVGPKLWAGFSFLEGDVTEIKTCEAAVHGADFVLHQAALGSVPRSLKDPLTSHASNVNGMLNMLVASRDAGVKRFVYASSSSTYGDEPALPKVEDRTGQLLSPYAVTKRVNELYASVFARSYGTSVIGLRYFNVFGPRQDPNGPYAAVIPKWIAAFLQGESPVINGDGSTSRDFTYVTNAVRANLLAALAPDDVAKGEVYNVAAGSRTTLLELYEMLRDGLAEMSAEHAAVRSIEPVMAPERPGDVRHSLADISKAEQALGYAPEVSVAQGIKNTLTWYASSRLSSEARA